MMNFIVSSPYRTGLVGEQIDVRTTHASLGYASRRFERLLTMMGNTVFSVTRPDTIRSEASISTLRRSKMIAADMGESLTRSTGFSLAQNQSNCGITHLSVAHWREMRLALVADRNICHLSWEQSNLQHNVAQQRFGSDMPSTLRAFDEVWACAGFVAAAVKRSGHANVSWVPTPIIDPRQRVEGKRGDDIEAAIIDCSDTIFSPAFLHGAEESAFASYSESGIDAGRALNAIRNRRADKRNSTRIFVTQGNPGDVRKNILGVIIAFSLFVNSGNHNSFLFVKIPPRTRLHFFEEMSSSTERLMRWGWVSCKNIFILPANFSDSALLALYEIADYYVCAPVAEGQNVPLQEAIQCGAYPISPIHTAMSEYLNGGTIAEISCSETQLDPITYCGESLQGFTGFLCDVGDIADALQIAIDAPEKRKEEQKRAIQRDSLERYTFTGVARSIAGRE